MASWVADRRAAAGRKRHNYGQDSNRRQAARSKEVSHRTVNLEVKLLRGILKAEDQWKRLAEDVSRLPETNSPPGRALTPEESVRLFTIAESKDEWLTAYLAATVANDTGMRGVELKHVRVADIDVDNRKLTITRAKGNNGLYRTVILTNDALKAVIKLLDRAAKLGTVKPEHYLFPFRLRKEIAYDPSRPQKSWRTAWRKLTKAGGVPSFRVHDLRHTFITNHAEINTPLAVVQARAGHLSKRLTELYTHISQRALEKAAEQYEQRKAEVMAAAKEKLKIEQAKSATETVN
jgi:integrase